MLIMGTKLPGLNHNDWNIAKVIILCNGGEKSGTCTKVWRGQVV